MLPRKNSCDILVKNVDAFYPCLKSLNDIKVKRFGLNPLSKEISKPLSIEGCVVISVKLIKIYNEK